MVTTKRAAGLGESQWAFAPRYQPRRRQYMEPLEFQDSPHNDNGPSTAANSASSAAPFSTAVHPTMLQNIPPPQPASSTASDRPTPTASSSSSHHTQPPTADTSSASAGERYLYARQALIYFEQTCQRLGWKHIDLNAAYNRALHPEESNFTPVHADQNFKIDFYEYYALIERALVLLQRVWGFEISRGGPGRGGAAGHQYHHNVLIGMEDPDHPLHPWLGTGDARSALWKAKELRNRWKDAATGELATYPLKMYNVDWLVGQVLEGLHQAWAPTKARVQTLQAQAAEGGFDVRGPDGRLETLDADGSQPENWDWMAMDVDMDWD